MEWRGRAFCPNAPAGMSERHWYLFSYDIRDPKRWRQVYKIVNGYGERLQYSLFRCHLTRTQMERARHALEKAMAREDDLIVIRLSLRCKVMERTKRKTWSDPPKRFDIV